MINQTFGKLTVIKQVKNSKSGKIRWLCRCACGNFSTVFSSNLKNGNTKSCGCLVHELKEDTGCNNTHKWLIKNKPKPELCERCKERQASELSYKDKEGYSRNPEDYEWLCSSCHQLKDRGSGTIMTKARIHRIREFYKCGAATYQELADLFKVGRGIIDRIINYKGVYSRPLNPEIFQELLKGLGE